MEQFRFMLIFYMVRIPTSSMICIFLFAWLVRGIGIFSRWAMSMVDECWRPINGFE